MSGGYHARSLTDGVPVECWGEPDGMFELCLVEVIAAGPRLRHEFERLLSGGEDPGAPDPILEAVELRERGEPARARALLEGLIEWDPRCLDAYADLGALEFDDDPRRRLYGGPTDMCGRRRSLDRRYR